jgi:putative chitinase
MLPTAEILARAIGCGRGVACTFEKPLRDACALYEIDTLERLAAFLATIGHESADLTRTVENLNYSVEGLQRTWPSRYTPELAKAHAHKPEAIANFVYGGRMGNRGPGDGWNYRGRGLIQVTGRSNYEAIGEALKEKLRDVPDLVTQPSALAEPKWAAMSAGCYWHERDMNTIADVGDFHRLSVRINGGETGMKDRLARYGKARAALA